MTLTTLPKKPRSTIARKKRTGQHRKHDKQYAKAYWPYLPLLLITVAGLVFNNLWGAHSLGVLGSTSDLSSNSLLVQTNKERTSRAEPALQLNASLTAAAQAKANDMVARNYWSHNTPDGKTPWTFVSSQNYTYQRAGENLAYGFSSAQAAVIGWMNSQEHRANILEAQYQDVGFGIASSPNFNHSGPSTVIVALYAEPATTATTVAMHQSDSSGVMGVQEDRSMAVSRVQLITGGNAPWSVAMLSILAGAAISLIIIRHGRYWHKALVRSEVFVIKHPLLDAAIVSVATVSVVLTRASGIIQ